MDGIQMEPIGKYKADRNGSAKAAWRNMVDQDLDDVAFLADSDKAREALESRQTAVAICSQRRALCITAVVLAVLFSSALIIVYATPGQDCPCAGDNSLIPGQAPTDAEATAAAANKERISPSGAVFPWRGARLPAFAIPKHYSLWLHPNLTTGELRGEVSIDFKVDRDTTFLVLNVRDMNVTERALFKSGGTVGPKIAKALEYPPAEQTYIEFKDKLRRKYNYTLSLRFITKLERNDKQRGFFMAGTHKNRCAVSRFWLTHARSTFPCFDEPHYRATFKLTIVRDRFHVSLTNMPIVATEEAGFYLGHRLLQDEFANTPPMSPHMVSVAVCRLQRLAAPPLATRNYTDLGPNVAESKNDVKQPEAETTTELIPEEDDLPPPEISLYSEQKQTLDEARPLLEWVQKTIQQFAYELNTSYPLPKLDIVVVESGNPYSEGWGLIILTPSTLSDTKTIARLLAQQWFGGLVSPRWWSSQWLMEALTSVLGEHAPPIGGSAGPREDALLLDHVLPALRLDSSNSARAIASPRLERADIEAATDELSIHKGAAIVNMAIEAAGEEAGRAALARLLRDHRSASADATDLWRALQRPGSVPPRAWDSWCERPGYPLLVARRKGRSVTLTQERFLMSADPPAPEPAVVTDLLTLDLRADLEELFFEPENFTEIVDDNINSTTTTPVPTTTTRKPTVKTTKAPPSPKWVIPLTFMVGPLESEFEGEIDNLTKVYKNTSEVIARDGTWYDFGNDTKTAKGSRWAENVTHLVWMNDTEMEIPDLGKHKWVRYNVGARGLYRVAPQDQLDGEASAAQYAGGAPAERALALDDALVLARAGRLPPSRALRAASRLSAESHWAPWRVVLAHLSRWRELLQLSAVAAPLRRLLATLPAPGGAIGGDHNLWLSGALMTAGVEWENSELTKQALKLFDDWYSRNKTIPDIFQEAAFTAGVRQHGAPAWRACWSALASSYAPSASASAQNPAQHQALSRPALLAALSAPKDDTLFHKFVWTVLSPEAQRGPEWKIWVIALCEGACRWRGALGAWQVLSARAPLPAPALAAAARCLRQPSDYYRFKEQFSAVRGAQAAIDTIALNVAWANRAEPDLLRYFNTVYNVTSH